MDRWLDGWMDRWFSGSLVRWIVGSMDRWFDGSMDWWFSGLLVRWFDGSLVRWIGGSMVRWIGGSLVRWFDGSMVRCWLFSGDLLKAIWIRWPQVLKTKLGFRAIFQNPFISVCDRLCILLCFSINSRVFVLFVYKKVQLTLSTHIVPPLMCDWGFSSLVEVS